MFVCCDPRGSIHHSNHTDLKYLKSSCIWLVSGILMRGPARSHPFGHHLDEKTKSCRPLSFTQIAFSPSSVLSATVSECEGNLRRYSGSRMTQGRSGAVLLQSEQEFKTVKAYAIISD